MTRRGWNVGAVVQPYSPLSDPILLWDLRGWDKTSPVPNQGSFGTADLEAFFNDPPSTAFAGAERFSQLRTPGDFPNGIDISLNGAGGPFAETPVTVMIALSGSLSRKIGTFRPAVLSGGGDVYQGYSQSFLFQSSSPNTTVLRSDCYSGGSTIAIPPPHNARHYFQAPGGPLSASFDSNQRDINHTLITFAMDFVHGGATVFENLAGINGAASSVRLYPGIGSGSALDSVAAAVGDALRWYQYLGPVYLAQLPSIKRPLTGGVGVHSLPGVLPAVFGVALFRGEISEDVLAYWHDYWFPAGQVEADLPYPNSVIVGGYDRTPGDPPATHTITVPANTYSVLCNITPSLAQFTRTAGINRTVIEVACQPGDQVQLIAGNRGSRWQSDGGLGGNPDGGNAGVNTFNGYHGLSGSGSCRVLLNSTLVAVIGGAGGGAGVSSTGDDVTGAFTQYGGGGPGAVGLSGARGIVGLDAGGFGGSQTEGGYGVGGTSGGFLQGGPGRNASSSLTSGTRLGMAGGGGGWYGGGGGGAEFTVGLPVEGAGGGSSWIDDSVVELIMTEDVVNADYGTFTPARNAVIQAFWGRSASWSPTPLPAPTTRSGDSDPAFNAGANPGVDGTVWAAARQSDGKILIGGDFVTARGATQNRIARLNTDGTLDTGFNTGGTIGVNGSVRTIAIQSDGKILIGGTFTTARGTTQNRIARLNTDGTLDTGFNTGGDIGASGQVNDIAIQSDSKVIIGGSFVTARGVTQNNVARLDTDGTLDTGFNTGANPGANGNVETIAIQSDGKIVIGGSFTTARGTTQNRIARLETDGSLDTGFNVGGTVGVNSTVNATAIQSDGKILIGGAFTQVRGLTGSSSFARLESDGSRDSGFTGFAFSTVGVIVLAGDGGAFVGLIETGTAPRFVRKYSAARELDLWFNSHVANNGPGDCLAGIVRAIVLLPDGNLIVGGGFTLAARDNALVAQNYIARLLVTPNPSA